MNTLHLARAADPLTSHMAAERVPAFAPYHHQQILDAIKAVGEKQLGATAREIAAHTGLTMEQVARRLPGLRESGRVCVLQYDGGDLMRGRCRIWALV